MRLAMKLVQIQSFEEQIEPGREHSLPQSLSTHDRD
jgi:hypothetical protein